LIAFVPAPRGRATLSFCNILIYIPEIAFFMPNIVFFDPKNSIIKRLNNWFFSPENAIIGLPYPLF